MPEQGEIIGAGITRKQTPNSKHQEAIFGQFRTLVTVLS
jgi:hypothetical protein